MSTLALIGGLSVSQVKTKTRNAPSRNPVVGALFLEIQTQGQNPQRGSKGDQKGEQISRCREKLFKYNYLQEICGGETGIRTLGGLAPTTVFETAPFDHSGTSPRRVCGAVIYLPARWGATPFVDILLSKTARNVAQMCERACLSGPFAPSLRRNFSIEEHDPL